MKMTIPQAPDPGGALVAIDQSQCNLLLPTADLVQVAPWHQMRVTRVAIDPDPDKGDVFKVGSRKVRGPAGEETVDLFAPGKPAIMRVSQAGGLGWNWAEHGVIERRPAAGPCRYVLFRAVGLLRLPDGTLMPIPGTYDVDLDAIEAELRMKAEDQADAGLYDSQADDALRASMEARTITKTKKGGGTYTARLWFFNSAPVRERWITRQVRPAMIQWSKTMTRRAETGAMLRVVRSALAMRSSYTREELAKPFLVARVEFAPDYADPAVRAALIQHGVAAMHGLFGQARAMAAPGVAQAPALPAGHPQEEIPADPGGDDDLPLADAPPPLAPPAPAAPELPVHDEETGEIFGAEPLPDTAMEDPRVRCADCGKPIEPIERQTDKGRRVFTESEIIAHSTAKWGKPVCGACGAIRLQANPPQEPEQAKILGGGPKRRP